MPERIKDHIIMKNCVKDRSRLNRAGGQAVLEGVMMKAGDNCSTACRKEDGTIVVVDQKFSSVRKKHKLLNIPIVRGVIGFFETMKLSVSTLNASAEAAGLEEEVRDTKAQKWLKKHIGISVTDLVMTISVLIGFALAIFLFMVIPAMAASFIIPAEYATWQALFESFVKILIFILYLLLISLLPDIKRTFRYHGAEHKSIACYESGDELTPGNAMKHTRFHPRCGTSFMFFMILLGIFVGIIIKNVIPGLSGWLYTLIRILILPLVVGVGYEFIIYAGKHDNLFVKVLSAPGLWMQRITTKEPDEQMLEVAITALKCALSEEFPGFKDTVAHYDMKTKETIPPAVSECSDAADNAEDNSENAEESAENTNEAAPSEGVSSEPVDKDIDIQATDSSSEKENGNDIP